MIISKTPTEYLFLSGSDYPSWYLKNGGLVISATINKYIYISCRSLPPTSGTNIESLTQK